MAHVRNITDKFDIPGEPGEFAVIRKLSWKQLGEARETRSALAIEKMKRAGGELVSTLTDLQRRALDEKKRLAELAASGTRLLDGKTGAVVDDTELQVVTPQQRRARLLDGYDLGVVLNYGVANVSYFEKFTKADLDDLDEPTAQAIGEAILVLSGVEMTEAEQQAASKNA